MAVSDLTGTKWLIKEWPQITPSTDNTYSINFTANNISFTALRLSNNGYYNYIYYNTTFVFDSDLGSWYDDAYRTIEIKGGTDVTNASLISWLETNATQQIPSDPEVINTTIKVGTKTLANALVGTNKLMKAYSGNHLIFERVGSNFQTADDKLLLTSNGDIFNVQEETSVYNVTISELNNSQSNLNLKSYLRVYDGQDTTGTLLIDSTGHTALQSTTVTCTTGYLYVRGYSTQGEQYTITDIENITGSITDLGLVETYTGNKLSVASDGSFVIETNYDYD